MSTSTCQTLFFFSPRAMDVDDDDDDDDADADADADADTDAKNIGGAEIFEKKVWVVAIDSVQKSLKSEPSSQFLSRLIFENALATFWRIQPIVPGFIALYPPLWHKSLEDRPNSPKSGV